jgi:hypothetical protein
VLWCNHRWFNNLDFLLFCFFAALHNFANIGLKFR